MLKSCYLCSLTLFILILRGNALAQKSTILVTSDTALHWTLTRTTQNGILHVVDTLTVEANKSFRHIVEVKKPTLAHLILNKKSAEVYRLWLLPNSTMTVELKNGDLAFGGKGSDFALYYKKKENDLTQFRRDYISRHPDFRSTEESTVAYLDSATEQENELLKTYFTGKPTNHTKQFIEQERTSILYNNLYYKLVFSGSDIEKFKYSQHLFKTTKTPYAYSNQIEFRDPYLLTNPYYQEFARQFVADIALKTQKANGKLFAIEPYIDSAMQITDELTGDSSTGIEIKILLLNKVIEEIAQERKDTWIPKLQSTLFALSQTVKNDRLDLIQKKLNHIIADTRLKRGNRAPDFLLNDMSDNKYSMRDFKGKKVFIDIGAAWCAPCIAGIPSWNALVASHQGNKNIVFISLSLDENKDAWQKWQVKHKPKGLLLNAGFKGFDSDFAKAYLVTALPKFILLDEEGKIDQYDAPSPDSKEMVEKLLLK